MSLEELHHRLIRQNSLFKVRNNKFLTLQICENTNSRNEETVILVYSGVKKEQFNSFLKLFLQCLRLTLTSVVYCSSTNTLEVQIVHGIEREKQKSMRIVFNNEYVVKDEELVTLLTNS